MNIGILTINDLAFHPNRCLAAAAQARGHAVQLIHPYRLTSSLQANAPGMLSEQFERVPDIVMPRQGSPMGEYGFVVMRQFQQMGVLLINSLEGVTIARHQFITLQTLAANGIPVPDSCFITRPEYFDTAVDRLGGYPVVAKQVSGMGGEGVVRIDSKAQAKFYLGNHLEPLKGLVVQQFIPPAGRQDLRILVIGERVAGAMALTPRDGDFRANIHLEGVPRQFQPSEELTRIAIAAARCCCLEMAGIDLILTCDGRPLVLEVNYSPGFRGLEAATRLDIAQVIIDYVIARRGDENIPVAACPGCVNHYRHRNGNV